MSQKDLDKLFRDALGEGRAEPRPDSWARVAAGLPTAAPAQPKRRVLWYRYAAAGSVVLAAAGLWWVRPDATAPDLAVASASVAQVEATLPPAPAARAERQVSPTQGASLPANSALPASPAQPNRQARPSTTMPNKFGSVRAELAFLERMSPVDFDERVPLIPRRVRPSEEAAYAVAPAAPRRRYAELASNLKDAWSTVRSIRESNAPPQVTVEVHVPAAVLQRLNQTKELAENLTESWSTFQSKHSH